MAHDDPDGKPLWEPDPTDAFAPPPRDPGGRNQLMTGALVIVAVAVFVFLVALVVGD